MSVGREGAVNRRLAAGAIAAAAAGAAFPWRLQGRGITQRGIFGGGLVELDGGHVSFSVFASRVFLLDGREVVTGSVMWVDEPAGASFVSTSVNAYEVLEGPEEGGELRQIGGVLRHNDEEDYPFVLNVLDAGAPGSGRDSVALLVGAATSLQGVATPAPDAGFSYAAAGTVLGDVQEVELVIGEDAATAGASATP